MHPPSFRADTLPLRELHVRTSDHIKKIGVASDEQALPSGCYKASQASNLLLLACTLNYCKPTSVSRQLLRVGRF